jgi:carbonic anhydrase
MTVYRPGTNTKVLYSCYSYDFKAPAEHTMDGDTFDLEMQLYCYTNEISDTSQYAIFSTFYYEDGDDDEFIEDILTNKRIGSSAKTLSNFYSYTGSQTQPDCQENVDWYVFSGVMDIGEEQLDFFQEELQDDQEFANGRGNNRKV